MFVEWSMLLTESKGYIFICCATYYYSFYVYNAYYFSERLAWDFVRSLQLTGLFDNWGG